MEWLMRKQRYAWLLLCVLFCAVFLCACDRSGLPLPPSGYDYCILGDSTEGTLLFGYPIPLRASEENVFCVPMEKNGSQTAFFYDRVNDTYRRAQVMYREVSVDGSLLFLPYVDTEKGAVFFSSFGETDDGCAVSVYEGSFDGMAVLLSGNRLCLADDTQLSVLSEDALYVYDVSSSASDGGEARILFSCADGVLYEYTESAGVCAVSDTADADMDFAWYVRGGNGLAVFGNTARGEVFLRTENGDICTQMLPQECTANDRLVYVKGTACVLYGSNERCYFADIRLGQRLEMDMGGLYRFSAERVSTDTLTLSQDGMFVYLYDIDFIYRLDLTLGELAIAYNEAPIYDGMCALSSMTPVTGEIVLLSQAANEYTEYEASLLCAVFDEELPEEREDDARIDLDTHGTAS